MILMQAQRQRDLKYPTSTELLRSSNELGWSTLIADLRSHSRYEGPGAAPPANAEVAIVVRGSDEGFVTCKVGGSWQSARPTTGSIWLRPMRCKSDEVRIGSAKLQVLHLYVPGGVFARLMGDYNLPAVPGRSIRYACGVQDELINQIGLSVLSEMTCPTTAGRMLVETSSLLLAARLAHSHFETGLIRPPLPSRHRLDDGRLRRVLAYVEEHLAEDIAVADLANVACLSIFHFTRAFAATMGVPPHRYVSQRRLEGAKAMIATGRASLGEIAFDCRFSSQSSFTRAFRRATGVTPAEYRQTLR
jgi:AraC family transcriptional regulator